MDSESFRAWQHLTLAGMLNGSYTGEADDGTYNCVLNVNTPTTAIASSGYYFSNVMPSTSWLTVKVSIAFGKCVGTSIPNTALLTPREAYTIDQKMDDGLPNVGRFMSNGGVSASGSCNGSSALTDTYSLSNSGVACYGFLKIF